MRLAGALALDAREAAGEATSAARLGGKTERFFSPPNFGTPTLFSSYRIHTTAYFS